MIYVLTHYTDNWNGIADITIPVMEQYCKTNGYIFNVSKVPEYDKYNGLHKLKALNLLNENDVAMLVDADVLITNHKVKIEYFYKRDELLLAEGANCGIMIVRKTNRGIIDLMIQDIESGEFNCEQDAVETYLKRTTGYYDIKLIPHPCFNSYLSELYPEIPQPVTKEQGQWEKGCFVLHLPALSIEKRIEVLTKIKDEIIYE